MSFESCISSATFKFLIGPDRKEFNLHSALVAHHSKPLDVIMNGSMWEAKAGHAVIQDCDEQTFIKFSQFIYAGKYDDPRPKIGSDSAGTASEASTKVSSAPSSGTTPLANKLQPKRITDTIAEERDRAWSTAKGERQGGLFSRLSMEFAELHDKLEAPKCKARRNKDKMEDYTEVFLCHARVFVFADKYLVEPLAKLALGKLHVALADFQLYYERIGDIVQLLRFVLANPGQEKLKTLVVHFVAASIKVMMESAEFLAMLHAEGSLATELIRVLISTSG